MLVHLTLSRPSSEVKVIGQGSQLREEINSSATALTADCGLESRPKLETVNK